MKHKHAFTLVEILVVVAIIVMMAAITLPGIRAMQAGSAHAEAMNTINAALQGVRSYAIMNNVKAAARFQPNGKIVFVYRFTGNNGSRRKSLGDGSGGIGVAYPQAGYPNAGGYLYLPVIDQEPLKLPRGYAAADPNGFALFYEPFYICYNPDGTLAVNEPVWVALVDGTTMAAPVPINPNFNGNNDFAWEQPTMTSYGIVQWLDFTQGQDDALNTQDVDDRKLTRYYYVAKSTFDLEKIFENEDFGADHYAGYFTSQTINTLTVNSLSRIALFKTPEDWEKRVLYGTGETKSNYVKNEITKPDKYEAIFLNPYTGRVIQSTE